MKKVLLLLLVAAGAYGVWRRIEEDRDLWAEVTDTLE